MNGEWIGRDIDFKYARNAGCAVKWGVGWGNKLARRPSEEVHLACSHVHDRAIFKSGACQFWIKGVGPTARRNTTDCRVHRKEKSVIAGYENFVNTIDI